MNKIPLMYLLFALFCENIRGQGKEDIEILKDPTRRLFEEKCGKDYQQCSRITNSVEFRTPFRINENWRVNPTALDIHANATAVVLKKFARGKIFKVGTSYKTEEKFDEKLLIGDSTFSVKYFAGNESKSWPIEFIGTISKLIKSRKTAKNKFVCVWLNMSDDNWCDFGCETTWNDETVECRCNHTTTFAVLLLVKKVDVLYSVSIAILVFELISIVCLMSTILFLLISRKGSGLDMDHKPGAAPRGQRLNRTITQINICFSILGLHSIIVLNFAIPTTTGFCIFVAFMTQFFLLATIFWCFNEGLALVMKMRLGFARYKTLSILQICIGWLTPGVVAATTIAMSLPKGNEFYISTDKQSKIPTKYTECVLSTYSPAGKYGVIAPASTILLINLSIAVYISLKVLQAYKNPVCGKTDESFASRLRAMLKSFIILITVLGLPWIILLFANVTSIQIVSYTIHGVVNGLQGLLLFLLYCVYGSKADKLKARRKISEITEMIKIKRSMSKDTTLERSQRSP